MIMIFVVFSALSLAVQGVAAVPAVELSRTSEGGRLVSEKSSGPREVKKDEGDKEELMASSHSYQITPQHSFHFQIGHKIPEKADFREPQIVYYKSWNKDPPSTTTTTHIPRLNGSPQDTRHWNPPEKKDTSKENIVQEHKRLNEELVKNKKLIVSNRGKDKPNFDFERSPQSFINDPSPDKQSKREQSNKEVNSVRTKLRAHRFRSQKPSPFVKQALKENIDPTSQNEVHSDDTEGKHQFHFTKTASNQDVQETPSTAAKKQYYSESENAKHKLKATKDSPEKQQNESESVISPHYSELYGADHSDVEGRRKKQKSPSSVGSGKLFNTPYIKLRPIYIPEPYPVDDKNMPLEYRQSSADAEYSPDKYEPSEDYDDFRRHSSKSYLAVSSEGEDTQSSRGDSRHLNRDTRQMNRYTSNDETPTVNENNRYNRYRDTNTRNKAESSYKIVVPSYEGWYSSQVFSPSSDYFPRPAEEGATATRYESLNDGPTRTTPRPTRYVAIRRTAVPIDVTKEVDLGDFFKTLYSR